MKRLLIMLWGLLSAIALNAQVLSPDVLATTGTSFSSSSAVIDFTIGELITSELTSGVNSLTEGFHQPKIIFESVENLEPEYNFSIYPNPVDQFVTVECDQQAEMQIQIYDVLGKAIQVSDVFTGKITLDLQSVSSGNYLFVITSASGNPLSTYKIIKN